MSAYRSVEEFERAFFPERARERAEQQQAERQQAIEQRAFEKAGAVCSEKGCNRGIVPCGSCVVECMGREDA